jgi:hypothetical protein
LITLLVLALAAFGCSGQPAGDQAAVTEEAAAPAETGGYETGNGATNESAAEIAAMDDGTVAATEAVPAREWPEGALVIGEPIQEGQPVKLAAVKASPTDYFEKTILVEATASAICQAKGCWMTITDGEGEPIWVRWSSGCGGKYAFPKDAAGQTIIVQGSFYEKEIDEAAAEHLAAENEKIDKDAIIGKTFEMNATGCVLLPAEEETKGA